MNTITPWTALVPIEQTRLAPQSYGIAMAQGLFGGPRGVWLECSGCQTNHVIIGSKDEETVTAATTDADCAAIFRFHGWTGEGDKMLRQRCPACSTKESKDAG